MEIFKEIPDIKAERKDSVILGALAYLPFGALLLPMAIYLLSKDDRFSRLHALNAIGIYAVVWLVGATIFAPISVLHINAMLLTVPTNGLSISVWAPVFLLIWLVLMIAAFCFLALMAYCMYLAYQGKAFSIPLVTSRILKYV